MATPLRVEATEYAAKATRAAQSAAAAHNPVVAMPPPARVRRQISPVSGRALEILGHAIEYLADEYVLASGNLPSIHVHDPQVEAMQVLMQANGSVYFACPVIPPLHVRLRSWLMAPRTRNA